MTGRTDHAKLIVAAQSGDCAALHRLLSHCQPDVRRYAQRHCATSDIDDAVQETLLIVARRVQMLRSPAAFAGWLFTVVRRECRRLTDKLFRYEDLESAGLEAFLTAKSDIDLRWDLAAALESLPPHYLEVLLLRDFEELTIKEIGARLGATGAVVKSRLHRARLLVREYLLDGNAA